MTSTGRRNQLCQVGLVRQIRRSAEPAAQTDWTKTSVHRCELRVFEAIRSGGTPSVDRITPESPAASAMGKNLLGHSLAEARCFADDIRDWMRYSFLRSDSLTLFSVRRSAGTSRNSHRADPDAALVVSLFALPYCALNLGPASVGSMPSVMPLPLPMTKYT